MSASQDLVALAAAVALLEQQHEVDVERIAELESRPSPAEVGRYAITADWRDRMPVTSIELPGNTRVVDDPERGQVLEVVTPAGQAKGFGAFIPIAPRDEIRYRDGIWFGPGFQWVNPVTKGGGGKKGGLALTKPTGRLTPMSNGGLRWNDGVQITRKADIAKQTNASLRFLWLKDRRVQTYFYLPDPAKLGNTNLEPEGSPGWRCYGWAANLVGLNGALKLRDGWNDFDVLVKLNTVGQRNGVLEVRINGELGLRVTDLVYRTTADVRISHLFPTWYHGGSDKDYPTIDNRVRLDGFQVVG
jgi:hypothetical protein